MQASTAYRMTVYRHHVIGGLIELVVSCRQVRLSPLTGENNLQAVEPKTFRCALECAESSQGQAR